MNLIYVIGKESQFGFSAVVKVIRKLKETGSIIDEPRFWASSVSVETKKIITAKMHASAKQSIRKTSTQLAIPISTIVIFQNSTGFIHSSYKSCITYLRITLIDELGGKNDFPENYMKTSVSQKLVLCIAMKLWFKSMVGKVNRQNIRYWSQQNSHFVDYSKQQRAQKIRV